MKGTDGMGWVGWDGLDGTGYGSLGLTMVSGYGCIRMYRWVSGGSTGTVRIQARHGVGVS